MGILNAEQFSLKSKLWLEFHGRPIIGEGRMAMLQAIQDHCSILHASRETGISYRRMRGAIRDMETALGQKLVATRRGGSGGGSAELTPAGVVLLESFKAVSQGFRNDADARLKRSFR